MRDAGLNRRERKEASWPEDIVGTIQWLGCVFSMDGTGVGSTRVVLFFYVYLFTAAWIEGTREERRHAIKGVYIYTHLVRTVEYARSTRVYGRNFLINVYAVRVHSVHRTLLSSDETKISRCHKSAHGERPLSGWLSVSLLFLGSRRCLNEAKAESTR